jgi:CARDB protein
MPHVAPLAPALAAGAALVLAAGACAPALASGRERAAGRAALTACAPGTATFQGRMRALPGQGEGRLQMRFALQARELAAPGWRRVALPAWTPWRSSAPGVPAYVLDRRVRGLAAPAVYRALVRFRWLGAEGEVLAEARAVSAACRQDDARPDLVVRELRVLPAGRPSRRRYVAVVANAGHGDARPFAVGFSTGGWTGEGATGGLAAGAAVRVTVTGPRCPAGATATAEADPDAAVDEADEGDNALTVACPD